MIVLGTIISTHIRQLSMHCKTDILFNGRVVEESSIEELPLQRLCRIMYTYFSPRLDMNSLSVASDNQNLQWI